MLKKLIIIIIFSVSTGYADPGLGLWRKCKLALKTVKSVPKKFYLKIDRFFIPKSFKNFNEKEFDYAKEIYMRQIGYNAKQIGMLDQSIEHKLALLEAMTLNYGLIRYDTKIGLKKATSRKLKRLKKKLLNTDFNSLNEEELEELVATLYIITHQPPKEKFTNFIYLLGDRKMRSFFKVHYQKGVFHHGISHYFNQFGRLDHSVSKLARFRKFMKKNKVKRVFDIALNTAVISQIKILPFYISKYRWIQISEKELVHGLIFGSASIEKKLYKKYKWYLTADIINYSLKQAIIAISASVALYTYLSIEEITEVDKEKSIIDYIHLRMKEKIKKLSEKADKVGLEIPAPE